MVANPAWINNFREAYVENLPTLGSNHGLILLSMESQFKLKRGPPFNFDAKWLLHESFRKVVHQSWKRFFSGSSTFQLIRKMDFLKTKLNSGERLAIKSTIRISSKWRMILPQINSMR